MKMASSMLATASFIVLSTSAFAQSGAAVQKPADTLPPAGAPADTASSDEAGGQDAIVVTGTQIRGIKPVGSNVLSQSREEIAATGVNDASQLLAQLPQSEIFLALPQPGGPASGGTGAIIAGAPFSPINRPNLRSLPGTNDSSGQSTLVLVDGHRIVPSGILQAGIDAGQVPLGVLERVEVILDGVSAVYGSDAVGGVINYITRKRFNGLSVTARYGFAKEYWQADASLTVGKSWDTGGIAFNYEFAKNSIILNRDRDFTTPLNYLIPDPANPGKFLPPQVDDLACDIPNVLPRVNATPVYHVSGAGLAAGSAFCNGSEWTNYNPAQRRHAAFVGFNQDIADFLKFDVTGLYSKRIQIANAGPFTATQSITPSSPYYRCDTGLTGTCTGTNATQRVSFSYGPLLGNDTQRSQTAIALWHITPQLTAKLGGDWQARLLVGHGRSNTVVKQTLRDSAAQTALFNGTTLTTTINPYNITDPRQNLALITGFLRPGVTTQGKQRYTQVRVTADGPLFSLPGGDVKVAGGAEWQKHAVAISRFDAITFARLPFQRASTTSKAVFGEIVAPIVGQGNKMPGIQSLVLSGSARYDDYGRYGTTFNPKVAATWVPVDWITVRGNWGTSFRAPNAIDKQQAAGGDSLTCLMQTTAGCSAISFVNPTNAKNFPNAANYNFTFSGNTFTALTLQGTDPNLGPETSKSWSIGIDISPPVVPGLTLSATYWNIDFKNQIGRANTGGSLAALFRNFENGTLYTLCYSPPAAGGQNDPAVGRLCTDTQIRNFALLAVNGQAVLNQITQQNGTLLPVAYLTDTRIRNLGSAQVAGIDLSGRYRQKTGFGSIDGSVNITILRKDSTSPAPGAPSTSALFTESKFQMTSSAGINIGEFRAQATLRHRAGFVPTDLLCTVDKTVVCPTTPTRLPEQTRIRRFDVVDLSFRYNVKGSTLLTQDLQLSLNINNAFNSHPAFNKTTAGGVTGGQTLGRLIQFGISKDF